MRESGERHTMSNWSGTEGRDWYRGLPDSDKLTFLVLVTGHLTIRGRASGLDLSGEEQTKAIKGLNELLRLISFHFEGIGMKHEDTQMTCSCRPSLKRRLCTGSRLNSRNRLNTRERVRTGRKQISRDSLLSCGRWWIPATRTLLENGVTSGSPSTRPERQF